MNIAGLSDRGLVALWQAIQRAFLEDDLSIQLGKSPEYGVRSYKDWKEWSDQLEAEMGRRNMQFSPIPW